MKKTIIFLALLLIFPVLPVHAGGCGSNPFCTQGSLTLAQNTQISPDIIARIQSQFNGRVLSITPSEDNHFTIQMITSEGKIILIAVDGDTGNILSAEGT